MGAHDSAIAAAKRIIAAKGEACSWAVPPTASVPDDTKPWLHTATGSDTTYAAAIVFLPMNRMGYETVRLKRGSDVKVGSEYGLMGAVEFVPDIGHVVTRTDGTTRTVINIDTLAPAGDAVLHTIYFDK